MQSVLCPEGMSESIFNTIMGWDMSRVQQRMIYKHSCSKAYAEQLELEWKKYICLIYINPEEKFPMSAMVDAIAHEHILDTKNIRGLCEAIKPGTQIDHTPTVSEEENKALLPDYLQKTIVKMKELFRKEPDEDIWPRDRCLCNYCIAQIYVPA